MLDRNEFNLDKGVVVICDNGAYLMDVREKRDFTIIVKKPEPQSHNITVVIQNSAGVIQWDEIISQIKNIYGDNLSSLLDSDGKIL